MSDTLKDIITAKLVAHKEAEQKAYEEKERKRAEEKRQLEAAMYKRATEWICDPETSGADIMKMRGSYAHFQTAGSTDDNRPYPDGIDRSDRYAFRAAVDKILSEQRLTS